MAQVYIIKDNFDETSDGAGSITLVVSNDKQEIKVDKKETQKSSKE